MSDTNRTPAWWAMSPWDIAALLVIIGAVCGLSWWMLAPQHESTTPAPSLTPFTVQVADTSSPAERVVQPSPSPTPSVIAIHVVGAVNRPGVVILPSGSRAESAITAAGGFAEAADQRSVNLAQLVTDGQQLVVGVQGEGLVPAEMGAGQSPGVRGGLSGNAGVSGHDGVININTASQTELEQLPGVGPKTAEAIVAYRSEHGPFSSVDHLEAVPGIGRKTIDGLRERARP